MHFLIVGGGIAGVSAAETLRRIKPNDAITIISAEPHRLYSRVLLPRYVNGDLPRERVFFKAQDWYTTQNITFLHDRVLEVDPTAQSVSTISGERHTYDQLLLATGGTPLPFGNTDPRVHRLQTLDDADQLFNALVERTNKKTNALVVGGGYIATEFIDLFANRNFNTTVRLRGERFFSKSFSEHASHFLARHLSKQGITIETNHPTTTIEDHWNIVGAGIGLDYSGPKPFLNSGGLETDSSLHSIYPNIFSVGDCIRFPDPFSAQIRQVGTWMNALMQGKHAAALMAGDKDPFEPFRLVTSYSTHVCGLTIVSIGDTSVDLAGVAITIQEDESGLAQFHEREGRMIGAVLLNRHTLRMPIVKAIEEQKGVAVVSS